MPPDRLRSIVPMFGGGTQYVETLDVILEFVASHNPTTDELVGWPRLTRLQYTVVDIAGVVFVFVLAYWDLLWYQM